MYLNIKMNNEIPLVVPGEACCNCFGREEIEMIETDLRYMPLLGLAGTEVKIPISFPYCIKCKPTAARKRPGILRYLAISTLIFCLIVMSWLFYFSTFITTPVSEYIFVPASAIIALAIVAIFYFFRKAKPSQTSYYQPVKLNQVRGKWPNSIGKIKLAFTNKNYKEMFVENNHKSIDKNILEVT